MALGALALGFVACDDIKESDALPQTNPQETIFNADNLVVTDEAAINVSETPGNVKVATWTVTDLPEASTLAFVMEIAKTNTYANAVQIECTADAETSSIYASGAEINTAYKEVITRNPATGTANVRFIAMAKNGTETVRLGGINQYYGVGAVKVTPVAESVIIDNSYTLVVDGTDYPFLHSDVDPYDDPKFSIVLETQPGQKWQIKSATGKIFGPESALEQEGTLVANAEGEFTERGPHSFEIDMRALTYKIAMAIPQLYTPGNSNGWNQGNSQILTTTDYITYTGFAHLNGQFKFSSQADWNGINYGSTGVEGELTNDGGAGNLEAPKDALYWCQVNLVNMTYTLTEITSAGCIGGFNGWGSQENLAPSADFLIWTGSVKMGAGDEWKFRFNDDWGINLGGALDNLVSGGPNILQAEAGTYTVTLNLSAVPYTATVVKQ